MLKDESLIPEGMYCYTYKNGKQIKCPYWKYVSKCNAHCDYLDISDNDIDGLSLLWDQCKECGIKDEYYPHDDPYVQIDEITKSIKKLEDEHRDAETRFDMETASKLQNKLYIIYDDIDDICRKLNIDDEPSPEEVSENCKYLKNKNWKFATDKDMGEV